MVNIFDQAKSLVQEQLLNKREDSVLGIDIGQSAIKVVQLKNESGVAVLDTYGEIALGPYKDSVVGQAVHLDPETTAKALKELLQGAGVTSTTCGVSVPFASSLVKLIEVPALDAKQLQTVIPIEARRYVPVPITEVQLDWFVVPETEQRLFEGQTDGDEAATTALEKRMVLVVAMHNSLLQAHAKALQLAGLSPMFYEIEAFSVMRSSVERTLTPVAVMDIGAASTKLYVIELGIILASHVVQKGSGDITKALSSNTHVSMLKAEEIKRTPGLLAETASVGSGATHAASLVLEQVFAEMRRVLSGFERRYNKAVSKVVLTGGGASLAGLEDFARTQLELEVELARPFAHVQAPSFLDTTLQSSGVDFSVAVGLALRAVHENA